MKLSATFLASLVSCVVATAAFAETSAEKSTVGAIVTATTKGAGVTAGVSTKAVVESVDHSARSITLKGENGHLVTVKVPEFAHNFNQVNKGDKVLVEYTEALAIDVKKADGSAPTVTTGSSMERAPLGANPAGKITSTVTISALVESIDYDKRHITLKGPEGNLVTLKASPEAKHFNEVKKGEQVVATYTEALAVKLEKQAS